MLRETAAPSFGCLSFSERRVSHVEKDSVRDDAGNGDFRRSGVGYVELGVRCVTALTRFTTDAQIKIQTPSDGKVQSLPNQAVDVLVQRVEIEPGGYSGWHSHPGQGFVVPTAGEVEIYDGDDPTCTPKIAGVDKEVRSYIEPANHIHYARNVGTVKYEAVATFLLPVGAPSRTDEPSPGNCPF